MTPIKATVKDKRLHLDVPPDWPDGTEVEIHPLVHEANGQDNGSPPGEIAATVRADLEYRFRELVRAWKDATEFTSSGTELVLHPAYQQIIGMGPAVLPLLFEELRRDPDHWFAALKSISGDDPVPPEDRGKVDRMMDAWLTWGRLCQLGPPTL